MLLLHIPKIIDNSYDCRNMKEDGLYENEYEIENKDYNAKVKVSLKLFQNTRIVELRNRNPCNALTHKKVNFEKVCHSCM